METLDKKDLAFRYGIDPYLDWVKAEGVPVHEDQLSLNMLRVDVGDWPRFGVKGAIAHFIGRGDFCSMFCYELPAGRSTNPVRHMYEEICIVLEGRGSTQLELTDGTRRSFEWGPRSFFAIPLNAKFRHFNGSGTERARIIATTSAPLMMKLFHNVDFIFGDTFEFSDRLGKEDYYNGGGDLHVIPSHNNVWETNFVLDLNAIELYAWDDRGPGSTTIMFSLADSNMHAHISEIAPATYKKAHRHTAGTHVTTLSGGGYSLLWYQGDQAFKRVDWEYGVVFPPLEQQFHQHFVTSNNASRYVAVAMGGMKYPLLAQHRRQSSLGKTNKSILATSVKEGGDQIEYEDQDPRIHPLWLEEMKKAGIEPKLAL